MAPSNGKAAVIFCVVGVAIAAMAAWGQSTGVFNLKLLVAAVVAAAVALGLQLLNDWLPF